MIDNPFQREIEQINNQLRDTYSDINQYNSDMVSPFRTESEKDQAFSDMCQAQDQLNSLHFDLYKMEREEKMYQNNPFNKDPF